MPEEIKYLAKIRAAIKSGKAGLKHPSTSNGMFLPHNCDDPRNNVFLVSKIHFQKGSLWGFSTLEV